MPRLLVPYDGSPPAERAIEYAIRQTRGVAGSEIHLLHVHAPVLLAALGLQSPGRSAEEIERERARTVLGPVEERVRAAGIACEAHSAVGRLSERIAALVASSGCEEVVMGAHGTDSPGLLPLDLPAADTIRLVAVPVTLVRWEQPVGGADQRPLLAVDDSLCVQNAAHYLARRAREARSMRVFLVNVQERPQSWQTHGIGQEAALRHLEQVGRSTLAPVERIFSHAGVAFESEVRFGRPALEIPAAATAHECDRVVMGVHGSGPIPGLVVGTVTFQTLHTSPVPLTLIK